MSIVRMKKIRLVGLYSDKRNILDALTETGAIQLSEPSEIADTFVAPDEETKNGLFVKQEKLTRAIDFVADVIMGAKGKDYCPKDKNEFLGNFFVSVKDFLVAGDLEREADSLVEFFGEQSAKLTQNKAEKIRLYNSLALLKPYEPTDCVFSDFNDTEKTAVFFGTLKAESFESLSVALSDMEHTFLSRLTFGVDTVILAVTLKENAETLSKLLAERGFNRCPFKDDETAKGKMFNTQREIELLDREDEVIKKVVCARAESLRTLKIYADYTAFLLERVRSGEKFRRTEKTFVLEGFVPEPQTENVLAAINGVTNAVFTEITDPEKDEFVPTLVENNKFARQTEFITDTYSVPDYREIDPSHTVFFFFMVFMGVIMADVGYGALMIAIGLLLSSRIKVDNGTKRLWNIIAIGGAFSIIFGLLFNSFFGIGLLPVSVFPDPTNAGDKDAIMLVLLGCLGLGVIQIAVGYFIKALNCFKQKKILDGILDGLIWVLFFIGFVFAAFNFLFDYLMSSEFTMDAGLRNFFSLMAKPGLYVVLGSVAIAALTAGRKEKGFGKFSKGFGAVYGLINIMSDILSYARLFGLMLSGMIIAKTFNDIGGGLMSGGGIGIAFGIAVIIVGHVFNIAMGVLGAYIHDSRLQYIEYFSKFYTGEGEKFAPLGSGAKYVYLTK